MEKNQIVSFQANLSKYEQTVADLLGSKYGITPQEFMVKVLNIFSSIYLGDWCAPFTKNMHLTFISLGLFDPQK